MNSSKNITIWVALAVTTFVLGTLGFLEAMPSSTIFDALFAAVQLFTLESGSVDGPTPIVLEIARWMAVGLSGTAVYSFARGLAADWILNARLGLERAVPTRFPFATRSVVIGLGRKGMSLIEDLRAQSQSGIRVLGIDSDPERVQLARKAGVDAIVADATEERTLRLLPWHRTSSVVLLMGSDEPNVTAALSIGRVRGAADTKVAVHLPNLQLRNLMARQDALKQRGFRLFNYYERLARRTLLSYPVEARSITGDGSSLHPTLGRQGIATTREQVPHVFIRPSRDFTPALIASLARSAHIPNLSPRPWNRIKVILVGQDADTERAAVQQLHPALRRTSHDALIDLETIIPQAGESPAQAIAAAADSLPSGTPISVFLDVHESGAALIEALAILDGLGVMVTDASARTTLDLRCIFDYAEESAIVSFVEAHPALQRYFLPLPSMAECCGGKALFDSEDQLDRLARVMHAQWDSLGKTPWETLTLELQDSNRAAADHVGTVLRQALEAGRDPRDPAFQWEDQELEALAECEHRRWAAQKLLAGWTADPSLGELQDKERKRHGCLALSYEQLSEDMKNRDRDNVRLIPKLLTLLDAP